MDDSRLQEVFKACEEQTEIMNTARRNSGPGATVELPPLEALRYTELQIGKGALMSQVISSHSRQSPVRREAGKVGRNDPCPCGSGKKYKKCHGA